jgi:predicted metalloprotease with PDZ domain
MIRYLSKVWLASSFKENPLQSIVLICLLFLLASGAGAEEPSHYLVTMPTASADAIEVEAKFDLQDDVIAMVVHGSAQLPNGQADLVELVAVIGENGRDVTFEDEGMGDWKLVGVSAGERVTVRYRVKLEHGNYDWNAGIDEMAYRTEDGLFFTGHSLFMIAGFDGSPAATVVYDLPKGWHATTPWDMTSGGYQVDDTNSLIRNCFFLGTHQEESIELDGFTFTLVLDGVLAQKRDLFVAAMAPVLPAARKMFGGMPLKNRYLAIISQSDRSDGGAFSDSYSMLIKGEVDSASSVIWGHGIAHELVHFWNGHSMAPNSQMEEWFKEGFTDYVTLLIRSREGLDSRDVIFRKLENAQRRFLISRMIMGLEMNMRDAAENKHRNRMLVYGGGTLVAFALDVSIREATKNERGMDDYLAAVFAEYGDGKSQYGLPDLIRIASEVAGQDMTWLFDEYVTGVEMFELDGFARGAGLRVDTMMDEIYLTELPGADAGQRAVGASILGN